MTQDRRAFLAFAKGSEGPLQRVKTAMTDHRAGRPYHASDDLHAAMDAAMLLGFPLLLTGEPGSGKTHLAAAVLGALIRRYSLRGRFVDFSSLINQIQSTFDPASPESKHDILDPVMEAELLVNQYVRSHRLFVEFRKLQ